MRQRLIFFASAFLFLAAIAYFLRPLPASQTATSATSFSSQPSDVQSSNVKGVANANASTGGVAPQRESASEPVKAPSSASASPSTESAALGYLQSNSKRSWDFKRDDFSNRIRTLSGGELESKSLIARDAGDQFVKFYSQGLFGVDPAQVKFNREEVTDRTRLIYEQVVDGTPVYGGSLSLFFENGSLTRVQNDLAPFEIQPGSRPSQVAQAFTSYKATQASLYDVSLQPHASNRTILYPNGHSLVYAYEFVTTEADKGASDAAKSFHVVYDADDKFVIQRRPSAIR